MKRLSLTKMVSANRVPIMDVVVLISLHANSSFSSQLAAVESIDCISAKPTNVKDMTLNFLMIKQADTTDYLKLLQLSINIGLGNSSKRRPRSTQRSYKILLISQHSTVYV